MYKKANVYIFFLLLVMSGVRLRAQTVDSNGILSDVPQIQDTNKYHISGVVKDKKTGEPVPFATITFQSTQAGAPANLDGVFDFEVDALPNDTLEVNALGYKTFSKKLDTGRHSIELYITLENSKTNLTEVVVYAGEDPAITLIKNVIRNKDRNNPDRTENYYYEAYNKIEIDVLNLSKDMFETLPVPYLRKFSFIYNNQDTSDEGDRFVPFFLTEALSDFYFQRNPKRVKEVIKATQIRGINNRSLEKYMGTMNLDINPYDNYLPFFDKKFVSPLNNAGPTFYKYKITDTLYQNGHRIIEMSFKPERLGENCFAGTIRIADTSFALAYIAAKIPKEANVNWVKGALFYKEYAPVGDSIWFCNKEHLTAKILPPADFIKPPGFIARKTTYYNKIQFNTPVVQKAVAKYKPDVTLIDTAKDVTEETWTMLRPDTLSKNERAIYNMFDTLEQTPAYRNFKNLMRILVTGVVKYGPLEIGPYWNMYSYNRVEGNRVRFSLGTTPKLFKDAYINGHIAYGFGDNRYKGSLAALWITKRMPRTYIFASYTSDIDRTVNYYDKVSYDNLFTSVIRKSGIPPKFMFAKDLRFEFFKEYYSGFRYMFTFLNKQYDPYDPLPDVNIFTDANGNPTNTSTNTEVNVQFRYAFKEKFLEGNYYRYSLGSKYPIVEMRLGMGIKGILNSTYEYQKVTFTVSDNIKIAPLGSLYLNVFGGKYFGNLPYNLLESHPGNEFYSYNKYAFNMMNQYEFLSDQYVGLNLEHSLGSGIFGYIPLIKKLKFRQFWTAKGIVGSLSANNQAINLNKGFGFKTLEGNPYLEVGTGVENILKLFRIDFVWRVTPKALPTEPRQKYFGIFGSMRVNF